MKRLCLVIMLVLSGCDSSPQMDVLQSSGQIPINGKKVSHVVVSDSGRDMTIIFDDGSQLRIVSYKYSMRFDITEPNKADAAVEPAIIYTKPIVELESAREIRRAEEIRSRDEFLRSGGWTTQAPLAPNSN